MYPTDRDFSKDKSKPSLPKSSPLRRRLTSRLQPLHGGMGFGSNAIRERAMVVARQATQKRAQAGQTFQPTGDKHLMGPQGEGLQFTEEITVVRGVERLPELTEIDLPEKFAFRRESMNDKIRLSAAAQVEKQARLVAEQAIAKAAPVPSIKSFISATRRVQPPSLLQSLLAWFFDSLVVVSCLVVGFTVSASVPFVGLLAHKFPTLIKVPVPGSVQFGSLGWMMLMMQTLAVASTLLFFVQTIAGVFLSASIGRAIANVQIASSRSALGRGLKIGFGELLQWPFAFGLLNAIVSPEHNFILRSVRWARGGTQD
ncbi:MAG: hypothetical protein ACO3A4_00550 [Silvanigrellaceae bacterium]